MGIREATRQLSVFVAETQYSLEPVCFLLTAGMENSLVPVLPGLREAVEGGTDGQEPERR
jgi:hypothetical protein